MKKQDRYFFRMGQRAKAELIDAMTRLAEDAMKYAYERGYASKTNPSGNVVWKDKTENLSDSFASAVYVNGELQPNTIRYINPTPKSTSVDKYARKKGRDAANDYLNRIKFGKGKSQISLVVVAAMYYTKFLQEGTYIKRGGRRGGKTYFVSAYRIQVVSSARQFITRNYQKYVGHIYKRWGIPKYMTKVVNGDLMGIYDYYNTRE